MIFPFRGIIKSQAIKKASSICVKISINKARQKHIGPHTDTIYFSRSC